MLITGRRENENAIVLECNNSEIEFAIPKKGKELDLIRTKVKINVSNKYTANDIHVLQEQVFKELGIETKMDEIERR